MSAKFKFEDLQPHVDMLCDALENKGASSSGISNELVYPQAKAYRHILSKVRANEIEDKDLLMVLATLKNETLELSKNNQKHRIEKIVNALNTYIIKEYNKSR